MDLAGYKINDEYYCGNCTREYCLFNLCAVLTENEMVNLMPTKRLATDLIVKLMNLHGGDVNGVEIQPYRNYDFSETLKQIRYLSELQNLDQKQCAKYHEFSHPSQLLENSIYQ